MVLFWSAWFMWCCRNSHLPMDAPWAWEVFSVWVAVSLTVAEGWQGIHYPWPLLHSFSEQGRWFSYLECKRDFLGLAACCYWVPIADSATSASAPGERGVFQAWLITIVESSCLFCPSNLILPQSKLGKRDFSGRTTCYGLVPLEGSAGFSCPLSVDG